MLPKTEVIPKFNIKFNIKNASLINSNPCSFNFCALDRYHLYLCVKILQSSLFTLSRQGYTLQTFYNNHSSCIYVLHDCCKDIDLFLVTLPMK